MSRPDGRTEEQITELFVGLDGNKPHVLPSNGFRDGLGVKEVALVRLEKWLHELRRD